MRAQISAALVAAVLLCGCVPGCNGQKNVSPPSPSYLAADERTHKSAERIVRKYAEAYPDEKATVDDWHRAWGLRIERAKKGETNFDDSTAPLAGQ